MTHKQNMTEEECLRVWYEIRMWVSRTRPEGRVVLAVLDLHKPKPIDWQTKEKYRTDSYLRGVDNRRRRDHERKDEHGCMGCPEGEYAESVNRWQDCPTIRAIAETYRIGLPDEMQGDER